MSYSGPIRVEYDQEALTRFQNVGLEAVLRELRSMGVEATVGVAGEDELFVVIAAQGTREAVEVFLYKDEAGVAMSKYWYMFERQLFESEPGLVSALISKLRSEVSSLLA